MNLARIQKYLNETDKAKESLHQAIELSRGLVQETPEPSVDEHCLAQCLHQLTLLLLQDTGQLEAAERHCLEAVKLYEKLADEAPSAPESRWGLAMAYTSFGNLLRKTGRTDEAAKCHLQALKLYEKLVVEFPTNHNYQNGMAWFLVTCSDPQFHDAARAVQLARKATELVPKVALPWNTLGVAHYRAGHWEEAIESLLKSTELSSGGSSYSSHDFFFLAMAHWQLGNTEEARQWYDKAVEWMEQTKPEDVELRRFRVEAEALLSISDAPMPNGKEVIPEQIE